MGLVFRHVVAVGLVGASWVATRSGHVVPLDTDQVTECVLVCVHVQLPFCLYVHVYVPGTFSFSLSLSLCVGGCSGMKVLFFVH